LHRPIASDRPRQLGRPNRLQKYATGVHAHKWWRTCSCARSLLVRERCVCPGQVPRRAHRRLRGLLLRMS
jgi:hypothetical protein